MYIIDLCSYHLSYPCSHNFFACHPYILLHFLMFFILVVVCNGCNTFYMHSNNKLTMFSREDLQWAYIYGSIIVSCIYCRCRIL